MIPSGIKVKAQSQCLELTYPDAIFNLNYEFLRVHSPSAEVRGHGGGPSTLQYGKKEVGLLRIVPTGNYALQLVFDDGHDSGLYDWDYLRYLCDNQTTLWQTYLERLEQEGKKRESPVINFKSIL